DGTKRPTRRLARVLAPIAGDYDYVFLDCPPSISLVSESVFEAADALLVPLIPATLSARTYEQLRVVVAGGPQLLAFFSMLDRRKGLHRDLAEQLPREYPEVLRTVIPNAADVERMGVHRTVLEEFAPRGRAARAYRELWVEIGERLANGGG
ncbi:MAG TPA: ParA family protein, partial [Solirubrobacteraceae bacterium]|nr:ParA family protein [Solirubrobacteraceae bacterium]